MHWYLGKILSRCAAVREDMQRPETEREMHHMNACAHLSLFKGILSSYYDKKYNNGFADHDTGRYVLGMILDDLQDTILTVLEKHINECKITVTGIDDALVEDHLKRVLLNRLSMLTYKTVCGEHIMCGNWRINNIHATRTEYPSELRVMVKFCSGGRESFSAEFRYVNDMWVCVADLANKYISDLDTVGCEIATLDN